MNARFYLSYDIISATLKLLFWPESAKIFSYIQDIVMNVIT